jgi:hypothetical protein
MTVQIANVFCFFRQILQIGEQALQIARMIRSLWVALGNEDMPLRSLPGIAGEHLFQFLGRIENLQLEQVSLSSSSFNFNAKGSLDILQMPSDRALIDLAHISEAFYRRIGLRLVPAHVGRDCEGNQLGRRADPSIPDKLFKFVFG